MDTSTFIILIISLFILIVLHLSGAAIIMITMPKESTRIRDTLAVVSIFVIIILLDLILMFVIQQLDITILSDLIGTTTTELDSSIQAFLRRNITV